MSLPETITKDKVDAAVVALGLDYGMGIQMVRIDPGVITVYTEDETSAYAWAFADGVRFIPANE